MKTKDLIVFKRESKVCIKACTDCDLEVGIEEAHMYFSKDKYTSSGYKASCKECCKDRERVRSTNRFSKETKDIVWERDAGTCQICGIKGTHYDDGEPIVWHFDHKLPIVLTNPYTADNEGACMLTCERCNKSKGSKAIKEIISTIPHFLLNQMAVDWFKAQSKTAKFAKTIVGGKELTEIKYKKPPKKKKRRNNNKIVS